MKPGKLYLKGNKEVIRINTTNRIKENSILLVYLFLEGPAYWKGKVYTNK